MPNFAINVGHNIGRAKIIFELKPTQTLGVIYTSLELG
jgi:hypothetical protein